MNDRSAKIGVWAYLLFTLASFALALYLLLAEGGYRYNVSLVALPVWMGYTAFNTIKSVSDLIGAQNRTANFTRMLARWEDTFESRGKALALFTFMTLVVGLSGWALSSWPPALDGALAPTNCWQRWTASRSTTGPWRLWPLPNLTGQWCAPPIRKFWLLVNDSDFFRSITAVRRRGSPPPFAWAWPGCRTWTGCSLPSATSHG